MGYRFKLGMAHTALRKIVKRIRKKQDVPADYCSKVDSYLADALHGALDEKRIDFAGIHGPGGKLAAAYERVLDFVMFMDNVPDLKTGIAGAYHRSINFGERRDRKFWEELAKKAEVMRCVHNDAHARALALAQDFTETDVHVTAGIALPFGTPADDVAMIYKKGKDLLVYQEKDEVSLDERITYHGPLLALEISRSTKKTPYNYSNGMHKGAAASEGQLCQHLSGLGLANLDKDAAEMWLEENFLDAGFEGTGDRAREFLEKAKNGGVPWPGNS